MTEQIKINDSSEVTINNYELIYLLKQYLSKHILELSDADKELFEQVIRRLQNAEY
jgi:hypothetical protein